MSRIFFPLFLIILAGGLFALYTNAQYQKDKGLAAELAQYNTALNQSEQLLDVRNQLLTKSNALPSDGVSKLSLLLPDNIDNIRLIIDINDIAARYHLQVEGISVGGTAGTSGTAGGASAAVGASTGPVGEVSLGFTVNASYGDFVAFLQDLERSLRLVDVSSISFTAGSTGVDTYQTNLTTYWLK